MPLEERLFNHPCKSTPERVINCHRRICICWTWSASKYKKNIYINNPNTLIHGSGVWYGFDVKAVHLPNQIPLLVCKKKHSSICLLSEALFEKTRARGLKAQCQIMSCLFQKTFKANIQALASNARIFHRKSLQSSGPVEEHKERETCSQGKSSKTVWYKYLVCADSF